MDDFNDAITSPPTDFVNAKSTPRDPFRSDSSSDDQLQSTFRTQRTPFGSGSSWANQPQPTFRIHRTPVIKVKTKEHSLPQQNPSSNELQPSVSQELRGTCFRTIKSPPTDLPIVTTTPPSDPLKSDSSLVNNHRQSTFKINRVSARKRRPVFKIVWMPLSKAKAKAGGNLPPHHYPGF